MFFLRSITGTHSGHRAAFADPNSMPLAVHDTVHPIALLCGSGASPSDGCRGIVLRRSDRMEFDVGHAQNASRFSAAYDVL